MKIHSEKSRIRAALVNSGKFDFEEAEEKLANMRVHVQLCVSVGGTTAGQAAFLTAVLTASRCFAEVTVSGELEGPLLLRFPDSGTTLREAALAFGAVEISARPQSRTIILGPDAAVASKPTIRAFWNGWSAGVGPDQGEIARGRNDVPLAGIAAAAMAVSQAFLAEQGDTRMARKTQGFSLWSPDLSEGWLEAAGPQFSEVYLPDALWLVGLGNLGQSFLWNISWLPYADRSKVKLFVQDDDLVGEENWGTSVLVRRGRYGILKTRVAEEWADALGFTVRRLDRRLDKDLKRHGSEPAIALAGLDRMPPRRLLGEPGFEYVVDAGLGAGAQDYQRFRINLFDLRRSPADHFLDVEDVPTKQVDTNMALPAYQAHQRQSGSTDCGTAELAGIPVAVPFVSALTCALAITQAVRLASNLAPYISITGEIADIRTLRATLGSAPSSLAFGSLPARAADVAFAEH